MIVACVAALALLAGATWWLVVRRARATAAPQAPTKAGGRFGGVEIRTRNGACDAARELVGKRFLAKNAPPLPLPSCAAARCACSFTKLADRRTDGRRWQPAGMAASLFQATNRRKQCDRRLPALPRRR
jgi:hypothetical protein